MSDWVVSMHGASYTREVQVGNSKTVVKCHQLIPIPRGITIYFYSREKEPLRGGWAEFNLLMGPPADQELARSQAIEVRKGPEVVPDYTLVGEDTWRDAQGSASGIFEVGNRRSAETWLATSHTRWQLSWLLTQVRPGESIYWLACRAWL